MAKQQERLDQPGLQVEGLELQTLFVGAVISAQLGPQLFKLIFAESFTDGERTRLIGRVSLAMTREDLTGLHQHLAGILFPKEETRQ